MKSLVETSLEIEIKAPDNRANIELDLTLNSPDRE